MRTFLYLLKVNININFGISALKYRLFKEQRRIWEPILIGISILIAGVSFLSFFGLVMYGVFTAGKVIGRPEMVLTLAFLLGQLFVMFFGILYIMNAFYFANDMSILIPLPLKPSHVMGSKFITVMINEYLTLLPIIVPALVIYGLGTGQGFAYWIKALILFLALPIIPLAISSLFVILLMRFVNFKKNKDLFAVIGGLFGLVLAVGINVFVQRVPEHQQVDFLKGLSSRIVETIGNKFPPSLWATFGLSTPGFEGLGYFMLFLAISAGLFWALIWIGNQWFYKSLLSGQEVTRKRRNIAQDEFDRRYSAESSPAIAIFRREWKLFLRTPIYVINGIAGMIVAPILILMPLFTKNKELQFLQDIISNPEYQFYVYLGIFGLMLLTSSMNIVACTSISREGNTFWVSKMIPVAAKHQVTGKLLHSFAVEAMGIMVTAIVMTAALKVSVDRMLILVLLSFPGALLIAILNLMIDVLHPKLEWTNPQEAVKQNINGFFGMLVSMAVIGLMAIASLGMAAAGFAEWQVYLVLTIISVALIVPALLGLFALAEDRYKGIEV